MPVVLSKRKGLRRRTEKNEQTVEENIRFFASAGIEELYDRFSTRETGLTAREVEEKERAFGKNIIILGSKDTVFHRLKDAVFNPFNIILLVVGLVTYFTDVVASPEDPDYMTVIIILALVFISSMVAFIQSQRSSAAVESLLKMISNKADVWRDGELVEIPMEDVVPGDIVRLSAGDMLPADVRFLTTKDTFVAQAALTGESYPVEKFSQGEIKETDSLTDLSNMGFMGSNIVSGSATALAIATGNDSYFGSMAETLSGDRAKTSFERGVDAVSRLLVRMMLFLVPIVFLINGLSKSDWTTSLLFAVSIAVGLTPEMLPVIMTSTLARGAVYMSRQKVIVRTLGAVQTFGEMDVLCTDKTGTLTEDKIVLERYMNIHGDDDSRVLGYAFLNSHFQTGLKNLIDMAIIDRTEDKGLDNLAHSYTRVDEIPFDFTRRRMSVVLEDQAGVRQLITKGAVEELLEVSSHVEIQGQVLPLDQENRQILLSTYEQYNTQGLRMLIVARKSEVPDSDTFSVADEKDLIIIGFVGFLDPPKESAKDAITALKNHGVRTVVLTGDSEGVAIMVCNKVGVRTGNHLTGRQVELMADDELFQAVKTCDLFAKMSPSQKERVVWAFQEVGHTVGYLGDGINDAPPLCQADVGISVDTAVDIAKETADIVMLEKDLRVLEKGVLEGRRTFGNIIKYIKMAASGNLGNMISVMVASIILPFLPMLPVQILIQNLLCDLSQMGMPFDNVDEEYLQEPQKWETESIKSFMAYLGPVSSIFDIACFAVLWWVIKANTVGLSPLFQGGWFIFGTVSQILVIHMIRTAKRPFIQSKASMPLTISTLLVAVVALAIGFTSFAHSIDMRPLPLIFLPWLAVILIGYLLTVEYIKKIYVARYGKWM